MRIGIIAPPWIPIPPTAYGGIESFIDTLACALQDAGHDVVLAASADSTCPVPAAARLRAVRSGDDGRDRARAAPSAPGVRGARRRRRHRRQHARGPGARRRRHRHPRRDGRPRPAHPPRAGALPRRAAGCRVRGDLAQPGVARRSGADRSSHPHGIRVEDVPVGPGGMRRASSAGCIRRRACPRRSRRRRSPASPCGSPPRCGSRPGGVLRGGRAPGCSARTPSTSGSSTPTRSTS